MYIKNTKFLVLGLGKSGYYATKTIINNGGKCQIYDSGKSANLKDKKAELVSLGAEEVNGDIYKAVNNCDIVVISPGVPIDSEIAVYAKKRGKAIISEVELGFSASQSPIVAVTGTNGKTTTCNLIYEIFLCAKENAYLVGNVGQPITKHCENFNKNTPIIAEISSFQMESTHKFCPHIGVVLNLSADHLDRHYTMENYAYLKRKMLQNMTRAEFSVLNFDDLTVKSFSKLIKAKCVYFSTKSKVDGAYIFDNKIYFYDEEIMGIDSVKLVGEHNLSNVLASVCVCKIMGIDNEYIQIGVSKYLGEKHRIEKVFKKEKVYIDDSKSTNIDSTIKAIECMSEPTVIILGGKDKGFDYKTLFLALKNSNVIHAVLTGENKYKMLEYAKKAEYTTISIASDFENAVKIASKSCPIGGNVLLSPATSSFDMFKNFEQRGDTFVNIVKKINEEI